MPIKYGHMQLADLSAVFVSALEYITGGYPYTDVIPAVRALYTVYRYKATDVDAVKDDTELRESVLYFVRKPSKYPKAKVANGGG